MFPSGGSELLMISAGQCPTSNDEGSFSSKLDENVCCENAYFGHRYRTLHNSTLLFQARLLQTLKYKTNFDVHSYFQLPKNMSSISFR